MDINEHAGALVLIEVQVEELVGDLLANGAAGAELDEAREQLAEVVGDAFDEAVRQGLRSTVEKALNVEIAAGSDIGQRLVAAVAANAGEPAPAGPCGVCGHADC